MTPPEEASPSAPSLTAIQARVRGYWETTGVPQLARGGHADGPVYRFTEGPPTANGLPHIGHVVGRTLKDTYLRFQRMRGHRIVSPMAGWDCHGLPVELEIEKRHGLKSKKEIEAYGVERFCEECRASTLETIAAWQEMSARLGYWLDYDRPYYTMSPSYIESVWWSLRQFWDKQLLEKGHYVLPYCPRCETPLSSHEVAQGYADATDPSLTVRVRLDPVEGEPTTYALVWTTTPWTLPANLLIAARSDLTYVAVPGDGDSQYLLAEAAQTRYFPDASILRRLPGENLAGRTYRPLFEAAGPGPGRYRIVLDTMVDAKEGTGFVHIAPSFGIDDARVGEREGVGAFDPLDSRGHFGPEAGIVAGKGFKSADRVLIAHLTEAGAVVRSETIRHTYPFCWRCSQPLIYRAIDSWFVRTSRFTSELVANNAQVDWHPAHLRDGRFGNFLTEAKDWALSRNRFWGTPLPVWMCDAGHAHCVGSFAELAQLTGAPLPDGFDPHRITVDRMEFPCPTCRAPARREPYTIDAWYDSGSAPFAQFHYPFEPGPFAPDAPLDHVAEGIDQTRGWFYSLLVLSTGLFHRPAYRVAVSNGHVVDAKGLKLSKSKGNAIDPMALLETFGGDAVRWSFLLIDHTEPIALPESHIRQASARTLGTLLNVFEFYRQNARLDGHPTARTRPEPKSALDRWLLDRLDDTTREVTAGLAQFEARRGALALRSFVDDLSTWYLRRSRPRLWSEEPSEDKTSAADCLSYALVTLARLFAPFAPFLAEHLYGELLRSPFDAAEGSVHLTRWPEAGPPADGALATSMTELRALVEVGRELRQRAGVRSRIPLDEFAFDDSAHPISALGTEGDRLLADELNVRAIRRWSDRAAPPALPDAEWVRREDAGVVRAALRRTPSPELLEEGLSREVLRRLQRTRKDMGLAYSDRIDVRIYATGDLYRALHARRDIVAKELLCDTLDLVDGPAPDGPSYRHWEIDDLRFSARVDRAVPRP
ncbi:MAG: isoleucine--tRNA ligase [Thermoplasmata archaeon]|nr:isoleucine--tRNA ligase [Thermoplasmata archaeon]